MVILDKKEMRKAMILKRKQMTNIEREEKSKKIQHNLFNLEEYKKSNFIFTFVSTEEEVDTHNIIKHSISVGKRVGVPITIPNTRDMLVSEILDFDKELEMGYYNILTPKKEFIRKVSPDIVDLVLVPGLIFSRDGYRVGYGGGYYDRFLNSLNVLKIGLCFHLQLQEKVPVGKYDIPVDIIVTDDEIIYCRP